MNETVTLTLLIPAYNEESCIEKTLDSVDKQILSENLFVQVIVVPNGCTDNTEIVVNSFIKKAVNKNIFWETIVLKEGSKPKALNVGLAQSKGKVVAYMDADSILGNDVMEFSYNYLLTEKKPLVGVFPTPDFSNLPKDSYLYQVMYTVEVYKRLHKKNPPVGRFIMFEKDLLTEIFPEDIASEDTWISLFFCKKYGCESVAVIYDKNVVYKAPTNWLDFLKQEARFKRGPTQLFEKYSDLEEVDKERIQSITTKNPMTPEELLNRLNSTLEKEGIPENILFEIKDVIFRIIREHAVLEAASLVSEEGKWEQIKSTK